MKKYILKSLFVSMLCMLAASCQDTDEFAQLDSRKAQVMFSVAMDSQMARSRTTWGDDYTPSLKGDVYDNHIELNQLVVKIEAGGSPLYVKDIVKWKDGEANEYKFVGIVEDVDTETTLTNVKISVFANMGTDGKNETFKQDAAENIPMWGMTTMAELKLAPGTRNDDLEKKPIYLLRAMAKLEVSLNSEMLGEYALTGVKLNKHNPVGNCLPTIKEGTKYTTELDQEAVMNVNETETQTELAFDEVETGKKYIVYLPEVENGISEADYLNIEVELTAKDAEGNLTKSVETGNFDVMDYSDVDNPTAIDIVRNHWYKYTVSGFAAGEVQVNYQTLDWQDVGIEVGGEGFLFLNKDVIEIYNANIDEEQLKFSSSSPITSIVLKDIYKHYRNGNILANSDAKAYEKEQGLEGEFQKDELYAYYMDKYGVLIQLSNTDVLSKINATADEGLNGGITINSPFINHETLGNSHFNTIRYLEFEVTNEQGYTATFRVMQYPPVTIVHEEGYFSYRTDFQPDEEAIVNKDRFPGVEINDENKIIYNGKPAHFKNYYNPGFFASGFWAYHDHEYSKDGKTLKDGQTQRVDGYENSIYGVWNTVWHKTFTRPYVFHRDYWKGLSNDDPTNRNHLKSVGPLFEKQIEVDDIDPETGKSMGKKTITKYYRRHYTGNFFEIFWSKVVTNIHTEQENVTVTPHNAYTPRVVTKEKDQADIIMLYGDGEDWIAYLDYPIVNLNNHRMYHIKTTISSDEYVIGYPKMDNGITSENAINEKLVSPSFMVASQLGETFMPNNEHHYILPDVGERYQLVKDHCSKYVETTYEDLDNDHEWDPNEPVRHYDDWRLPTKAEVKYIAELQYNSRVMDILMDGEYYFCAASTNNPLNYNENTCLSERLQYFNEANKGYYIRCVRDVKPSGQNGFVEYYSK